MEYLDFDLLIKSSGTPDRYRLEARSPAGEHRLEINFVFDTEFESRTREAVAAAIARSADAVRDALIGERELDELPELERLARFGQELFDLLFTGELLGAYRASRATVKRAEKGLRLRLHIDAPQLVSLPWEFVYDKVEGDYVCLSRTTPLIRYLDLGQPPRPLAVKPPLRVLGVVASPRDLAPLDVDAEKARIEAATHRLQESGQLSLTWMEGHTWRDLLRAMQTGPWHVLHYIGHGGFDTARGEGNIALADEAGDAYWLSATELGRLLADQGSLRLVVLNSCEGSRGSGRDVLSSTAATLMRRGIPAVVAMQYEITDTAAIEFARAFYGAVSRGLPVDAGLTEARKAMSLARCRSEWGTPVLHMRSPDGRLFDVGRVPAAADASARSAPSASVREAKPYGKAPAVEKPPRQTATRATESADAVSPPERRSRLGSALMRLPWKVIIVIILTLTVAALPFTPVRPYLIPENEHFRVIGFFTTLFVVFGFYMTVAYREWIRRNLLWFTGLSLITLALLAAFNLFLVYPTEDGRFLVGLSYSEEGQQWLDEHDEVSGNEDSAFIAAIGPDKIPSMYKYYYWAMGLYALSYLGFVLGLVMIFGGTLLPRRDRSPP